MKQFCFSSLIFQSFNKSTTLLISITVIGFTIQFYHLKLLLKEIMSVIIVFDDNGTQQHLDVIVTAKQCKCCSVTLRPNTY